ncbi:MAG: TIGR04563 family protein [Deltaproteobacteria bacterium]|jgi:uncharacterized small protein (TIGR04563 family)|nr:TIGR04563 family protein [Deltaproteobacteria bacterium]
MELQVSQKRKVTLYFNSAMLAETQKEAIRQDRSVSWIIQAAWRIAREEVKRMPSSGLSAAPAAGIPAPLNLGEPRNALAQEKRLRTPVSAGSTEQN